MKVLAIGLLAKIDIASGDPTGCARRSRILSRTDAVQRCSSGYESLLGRPATIASVRIADLSRVRGVGDRQIAATKAFSSCSEWAAPST